MIKYLKEYQFHLTLLAFLLIPILHLDTHTRNVKDYKVYDRAIIFILSPLQTLVSWTLDSTANAIQNYIMLTKTRRSNAELLNENRQLMKTIVSLREMEQENIRLRNLLGFRDEHQLQSVLARVIAKDVSNDFRAIRINRGADVGILKDMAVVTDDGVVGRVLRTTAKTSDIVTILDPLSAVDAIDKRSRARGIIEGMTDFSCQLKFALRTDDIQLSDLMISSGLGGIFPKGIPVGVVSKVDRKPYGITQTVEILPSVDFSKLEEVLVITGKTDQPFHVTTRQERDRLLKKKVTQ